MGSGVRHRAERLFLVALIACLCLTALLAIGITLFGSFDETVGQILATIALLGLFSLVVLPAGILLDRDRAVPLAYAVIALAAIALVGALVLVWQVFEDSDEAWRIVSGLAVTAVGAAQIATMTGRLRAEDPEAVTRLYRASIGTGVGFVALVCVALAIEAEDETFYRVLGAVGVLNLLVVLLQPALRRLAATREPAVSPGETVHRFRCTVDGARTVEYEVPAADFAAALATAVRELESNGARVTTIERLEPSAVE